MISVAALWRHPIKSHGRERLESVTLTAGEALPLDRRWAIAHADAQDRDGWMPCSQFMRGSRIPAVAGLWAQSEADGATITLTHRKLGSYSVKPDIAAVDDAAAQALFDWLAPLYAEAPSRPARIVSAGSRGMTDSPYPSVSICNSASHAAVAARTGGPLETERWRGNIWLDGLAPWEEAEWIGKTLRVGDATLRVTEPITRCPHTKANPYTGQRDVDTLAALDAFGHQEFGIYCEVVGGGDVAIGSEVQVL